MAVYFRSNGFCFLFSSLKVTNILRCGKVKEEKKNYFLVFFTKSGRLWSNDNSFQPILQQSGVLILRVGNEYEHLRPIVEDGSAAQSFIVGEGVVE